MRQVHFTAKSPALLAGAIGFTLETGRGQGPPPAEGTSSPTCRAVRPPSSAMLPTGLAPPARLAGETGVALSLGAALLSAACLYLSCHWAVPLLELTRSGLECPSPTPGPSHLAIA